MGELGEGGGEGAAARAVAKDNGATEAAGDGAAATVDAARRRKARPSADAARHSASAACAQRRMPAIIVNINAIKSHRLVERGP
mmetsp:Transcript_17485/g.50764  ORF Transcript_17485/g.50764 Transcript_17485/m.50764 type:complete len:84 (+) Transcript_17485:307-558(+)